MSDMGCREVASTTQIPLHASPRQRRRDAKEAKAGPRPRLLPVKRRRTGGAFIYFCIIGNAVTPCVLWPRPLWAALFRAPPSLCRPPLVRLGRPAKPPGLGGVTHPAVGKKARGNKRGSRAGEQMARGQHHRAHQQHSRHMGRFL